MARAELPREPFFVELSAFFLYTGGEKKGALRRLFGGIMKKIAIIALAIVFGTRRQSENLIKEPTEEISVG